ncbi:DUF1292 domain-containing protein [Fredinandcohnia humi]
MYRDEVYRDTIVVKDENGFEKQFSVEALFDMKENTYALLRSDEDENETFVMQVENTKNGQYLVNVSDPSERNMVLDAYEIAVEANPAE